MSQRPSQTVHSPGGDPGLAPGSILLQHSVQKNGRRPEPPSTRGSPRTCASCAPRGPVARGACGDERREPLGDLARRARRVQPDGGRAGQARRRRSASRWRRCSTRRPTRRRSPARPPRRPAVWRDPASGYVRRSVSPAGDALADPDRRGQLPRRRAGRVRDGPRRPCASTSSSGCSRARSTSRVGERRHRLRGRRLPGHAGSTARRCSTTRRAKPARYAGVVVSEPAPAGDATLVHPPPARARRRRVEALADVLLDCVEGGASIELHAPLTPRAPSAFWRRVAADVAVGERALLVAEDDDGIVGTVQLVLGLPENQPHRADLSKMLVHRRARRRGLGAALMEAAEDTARDCGRTLLVLDTDHRQRRRPALHAPRLGARRRHPGLRADAARRALARRRSSTSRSDANRHVHEGTCPGSDTCPRSATARLFSGGVSISAPPFVS